MAFLLRNPYAAYSGKQRLQSGQGEFGFWGDPNSTLEHFTEYGPGWSAGELGALRAKAEFAPYVTQQQWSWGDSYDNYWQADFDALNAAKNAQVAADLARYNTMAAWDDESLQMAGSAPNYAGQLARALGMTPQQYQDWSTAQGANWDAGPYGTGVGAASWNTNANPFVNQRIGLDTLINAYGLGSNAEIMNWRNSIEGTLSEGGDRYADMLQDSDSSVLGTFLKGAGFVAGALSGFSALGGLAGAGVASSGAGALGIPGGGFGAGANSLWGSALGELGFGPSVGQAPLSDSTLRMIDQSFQNVGNMPSYGIELGQPLGMSPEAFANYAAGGLDSTLANSSLMATETFMPTFGGSLAGNQYLSLAERGYGPGGSPETGMLDTVRDAYDLYKNLGDPFVQMGAADGGAVGGSGSGEGYRTPSLLAEDDALFGAKKFGRSQQLMPAGAYDTFFIGNPGLYIP